MCRSDLGRAGGWLVWACLLGQAATIESAAAPFPIAVNRIDRTENPCSPDGHHFLGRFEVTNAQYTSFLNNAQYDAAGPAPGLRSSYMLFQPDGQVQLEDGTVLFQPQGVAAASRIVYDPDAPVGQRYHVQEGFADHPVVRVSWFGAAKFLNWLNCDWHFVCDPFDPMVRYYEGPEAWYWDVKYPLFDEIPSGYGYYRLPDSGVWSTAAAFSSSAPDTLRVGPGGENVFPRNWTFGFGRDTLDGADANYAGSGDPFEPGTTPVGFYNGTRYNPGGGGPVGSGEEFQTRANRNPWRLYDMTGNVREWCEDFFAFETTAPIRGGSFAGPPAAQGAALVNRTAAGLVADDLGFRVLFEIEPCHDVALAGDCYGLFGGPDDFVDCCDYYGFEGALYSTGAKCEDDLHPDRFVDYFDVAALAGLIYNTCEADVCPCVDPFDCIPAPSLSRPSAPEAPPASGDARLLVTGWTEGFPPGVFDLELPAGSAQPLAIPYADAAYLRLATVPGDPLDRAWVTDAGRRKVYQLGIDPQTLSVTERELWAAAYPLVVTDLAVRFVNDDLASMYLLVEPPNDAECNATARIRRFSFDPGSPTPVLSEVLFSPATELGGLPGEPLGGEENWLRWGREVAVDRYGCIYVAATHLTAVSGRPCGAAGQGRLLVFAPEGTLLQALDLQQAAGVADYRATGLTVSPCEDFLLIASANANQVHQFAIARDASGTAPVVASAPSLTVTLSQIGHVVDLSLDPLTNRVYVLGDYRPAVLAEFALNAPATVSDTPLPAVRIPVSLALRRPGPACPVPADFDRSGHVDATDLMVFVSCATGPEIPYDPLKPPDGCPSPGYAPFLPADIDRDGDVDQADFARFQRCWSGPAAVPHPACAE